MRKIGKLTVLISRNELNNVKEGSNACRLAEHGPLPKLNLRDRSEVIKMESIRKLSNFNFQWTKILYQNNLKNIAFFLRFSRAKDVINHL